MTNFKEQRDSDGGGESRRPDVLSPRVNPAERYICRRIGPVDCHITAYNEAHFERLEAEARQLIVDFVKHGRLPTRWSDGIDLKLGDTVNHGGGGGP